MTDIKIPDIKKPIEKTCLQFTELLYRDNNDGRGYLCVGVVRSWNKWNFASITKKKRSQLKGKEEKDFQTEIEGVEEL